MDLHIHTPASSCYQQPNVTYRQILQKAEERGLDIIAITDHNTVAGIAAMGTRIHELELLERLKRLRSEEKQELEEYRRLEKKLLILPGFEFTATLGFHILGIFPPETSIRELEHILLDLRIPPDKLDLGSGEVGATVDVLTAYRVIAEAGGLGIAAHANSTHGVAMRDYDFGGQTKVAYTLICMHWRLPTWRRLGGIPLPLSTMARNQSIRDACIASRVRMLIGWTAIQQMSILWA